MKTTVDIPDAVFEQLRRRAKRDKTSLRALIEAALRQFLGKTGETRNSFKLRDASFRGKGLALGVREGDWEQIRELAYENRGGSDRYSSRGEDRP